MAAQWDVFCRVIDNYGDIGVCWRLARQLAAEHGLQVRLWVDDLASLQPLCHTVDSALATQQVSGVEIRRWSADFPDVQPAQVVIEAFACDLPQNYLAAMVKSQPLWINLEYLTAEPWALDCHLKPSPHPTLGLTKFFFFPGFCAGTGGLLREHRLRQGMDSQSWWAQLDLPQPPADAFKIALFGYENAAVSGLLASWQNGSQPVVCLLPEGRLLPQVAAWAGRALKAGDVVQTGKLTLHVLPFLEQDDYDRLLWACDCNFVRGEDSFVRAQWAAQPFVWHIYPQEEGAHWKKLEAFLDIYCVGMPAAVEQDFRAFWNAWNAQAPLQWENFIRHRAALQQHAKAWAKRQAGFGDLATSLVIFSENRI